MANFKTEREIEHLQIRNRLLEIWDTVYTDRTKITKIQKTVTGKGRGPERMPTKGWKPFKIQTRWGGYDETTWFKLQVNIPKAYKGQRVVALLRPALHTLLKDLHQLTEAGDTLAYLNGVPFQGIDRNHEELILTEKAKGDEHYEIALECCPSTRFETTHEFGYADLAIMHQDAFDFFWDIEVALKVYETLDPDFAPARQLLDFLGVAIRKADFLHKGSEEYYTSFPAARRFFKRGIKQFEGSQGMGRLTLTGHSHIDTAWLWPLRETRRKVGRTLSTVLNLMEKYPEYHFSFSQPELYMYLKEHFPELYKSLKKRVKEGRFEPCGAPWIEQDSNMAGSEALIRQFLYGNRFFRKEFGIHSPTAWLPDAFGYPWSLPQIMRKCQVDTFVTTKIDWSMFTTFPYSLFQWQGADGTRIRAVMPPLNYNGNPVPKDCQEQWNLFKQKDKIEELIFPFGCGDGGGGPTMEMLEHGKRLKNMIGVPKSEFGRTQDSLDRQRAQCPDDTLPVYNDELYLELHRACQTTQARTKRNNRKSEILLHDAELLSTLVHLQGGKYEGKKLWPAWRTVLTNQFHDILPGSSIGEVYDDADRDYSDAQDVIRAVRDAALQKLAKNINTSSPGTPILVFNTLSWLRDAVVEAELSLPKGQFHVIAPDGSVAASQKIGPNKILLEAQALPPLGHAVFHVVAGAKKADTHARVEAAPNKLENAFLRIKLDKYGQFTSIYDKFEKREVLAKGTKGNALQLFEDRPHLHDAWDIDHNFEEEKQWIPGSADTIKVLESGPVRATLRFIRKTEHSTITQDIHLCAASPRIDVRTHVDWHEKRTLLKVAFPVDILSPKATYHIQFATIERSTHDNTEHDRARFEVPAHHWADLSEGDYGVSLLNDCKYGYDVRDNVLRLSLLRASIDPDPHADQGENEMTYSLYPHPGDWRNGTTHEGYELNYPVLATQVPSTTGARASVDTLVEVNAENVIIETVKKSEDSNAIIVRFYEAYGQRGDVTLHFNQTPTTITECDMMEENDTPVKTKGNTAKFYVTPYEIRTIKVVFQ